MSPVFARGQAGVAIVGHRGSGKGDGENTLDSFQRALDAGATWIETDVRAAAGGELVIAHHPTHPDGRWIGEHPPGDQLGIDEVLDWLPAGAGLDLEIKTSLEDASLPREETTAARVAQRLARHGGERVLLSSFDPSALVIAREHAPGIPVGLLAWVAFPLRKAIPAAVHLGAEVVIAHRSSFGPNSLDAAPHFRSPQELVEAAHAAGLEIAAWSVRPEDAAELAGAGVDALVADDIAALAATL